MYLLNYNLNCSRLAVGIVIRAGVGGVGGVENFLGVDVPDEVVVPPAAIDRVEAGAAVDVVFARLAADGIATGPAQQNIIAVTAEKLVVAVAAFHSIALRSAVKRVVPDIAGD